MQLGSRGHNLSQLRGDDSKARFVAQEADDPIRGAWPNTLAPNPVFKAPRQR